MAFTFDSAYNQDDYTADSVRDEEANSHASQLEIDRKAEAEAANVQDARFIGYAEVLSVYNERSDTEPLADRRARELAVDPGQQSFTRHVNYTGNATAAETGYPESGGWTETEADDGTPDAAGT